MTDKKLAKLVVKLEAENGKLHRSLEKSESKVRRFEKKTKKSLKNVELSFGALAGAATAGLAFRAVTQASIEQENALRQLDARLKSTGGAAGITAQEVTGMAASLQEVTTFGDEAIIGMQNLLLTFTNIKKGDQIFEDTTKTILDMSVAMGQDLKSSAIQVGKALNDPIIGLTALSRVGVKFSDEQTELIKSLTRTGKTAEAQKIILAELQTEFGGAAEAARDTFGGALKSLGNAFGDLLEADNMGKATEDIETLTKIISDPDVKDGFATITSGIISIAGAAAKGLANVVDFSKALGEIIGGASGFGADIDVIEKEIEDLQLTIQIAKGQNEGFLSFLADKEKNREIIARSEERIAQLRKEQEAIFDARGSTIGSTGTLTETTSEPASSMPSVTSALDPDLKSKLEAQLAEIDRYNMSDFEKLVAAHEARIELINTNADMLQLSDERRKQLIEDTEAKHQAKLTAIGNKGLSEREKFERLSLQNKAKTVFGMLANITAGVANENKTLFRINQIAGIANATISTYEGVAKAWSLGPILGPPMAAITLAAGLAQVAAIKSQSFGVGSGGGSAGIAPSFAGTGVTNVVSIADQQEVSAPAATNVSVTINGGIHDSNSVRELIETINEEIGDGVNLTVDVA